VSATRAIKRRFGAKSALDYLIGEKLLTFAKVARDHPEFAAELPKFLVAIYRVFNQFEIAGYVASRKPTAARCSDSFCSRPDTRLVAAISTDADTAQGSERGALALEMPLMSLVASARARRLLRPLLSAVENSNDSRVASWLYCDLGSWRRRTPVAIELRMGRM